MKTIIAVDPGLKGGIAWRDSNGQLSVLKMPETEGDILGVLRDIYINSMPFGSVAYIEQAPSAMPGKISGLSKLNANAGFIRGCLMALTISMVLIRPAKWQQPLSVGTRSACKGDNEWKNKLKARAQERFPQLVVTLKTADALLILDYALNTKDSQ